ncbi:Glycosyl transferase family 54 [Trinorchestia longiramus]|nr:Glycosyl transferase family 54 [Trinorchestia longiramus]
MPTNTPTPLVLVILAALLLSCNVLWLYTTPDNTPRSVCGYLVDSWTGGHSGGRDKDLNVSVAALPGMHDYQLVRGSGLTDVPFPIPIPNDTIILGDDSGHDDGLRQRYMTIGIASVWRKEEYLHRTLDSLLRETSDEDKKDIFIFLLLADADPDVRQSRARALETRYKQHVEAGVIRVLQPPSLLYPSIDFATIRRTYNDPVSRVQWRTKQVLDFAFLFWYAWTRQPSTYYLILEDDVLAARHFVTAIRDFVTLHSKREWIALQLSGFMGIGQLVRCRDLDRLVSFLLLFYKEHPVDVLFSHWVSMMVPQKPPKDRPYRRVPGLFQHVGIHSTLANKTQTLRDSTFSLVRRRFSHVNPPAEVVTTIRQYKSFVAQLAYSSAPGMFWGIPKAGDTYDIVFKQPLSVSRIVIVTGATLTKKKTRDKLLFGQLQVSPSFTRMQSPKRASCSDFVAVKEFQNGEVDAKDLNEHFIKGIQCVRIVVGSKQRTWISISEIAVFTTDEGQSGDATPNPSSSTGSGKPVAGGSSGDTSGDTPVKPSSGEKIENSLNTLSTTVAKKSELKLQSSESGVKVKRDLQSRVTDNKRNSETQRYPAW